MNNTTDSSSGRKRRRDEDEPLSLSLEDNLTFTDTLVALRVMRSQFPQIDKVSIQPFILQSQIYSSVNDRTQVDRELESLRRDKVVRVFKLNTGQDDHAIMFLDDYLNQIERVEKRMEEKKYGDLAVLKWFKTYVIGSKKDPSIGHQELCELLSLGGKVKDEHISLLINAGVLIRQLIDPDMYWFAIPNIGSVLKGLSQPPLLSTNNNLSSRRRSTCRNSLLASWFRRHIAPPLLPSRLSSSSIFKRNY